MDKQMKRIGVLTSGGDAPGMNAAVRAIARMAAAKEIQCLGIRHGYNGLITGDTMILDARSVDGILTQGGTMLYTARCMEFMTPEGQKRAVDTCRYLGLDGLITIGGDGTFRGAQVLSRAGVPTIGIPGTIDNDIDCTEYTIGFDTACNTAIEAVDKLRDTMRSHQRCSVVEVMGRHAGYLALSVGAAVGATAICLPENKGNLDEQVIEPVRNAMIRGRHHYIIIVAEGAGKAHEVADYITEQTGVDTRVTILGHVQRGGSPTSRDRVMAMRMGYHAVKILTEGKSNRIVCLRNGKIDDVDIEEGLQMKKHLDADLMQAVNDTVI